MTGGARFGRLLWGEVATYQPYPASGQAAWHPAVDSDHLAHDDTDGERYTDWGEASLELVLSSSLSNICCWSRV